MQSDGLKWLKLDDPDQGEILLMVPIPHDGDPWGSLAVLRGTIWESLITVVTGAAMSDAMHGWATGLVRTIGIQMKYGGKRVLDEDGVWKMYAGRSRGGHDGSAGGDGVARRPLCGRGRGEGVESLTIVIQRGG
jgi:hypothetical protein